MTNGQRATSGFAPNITVISTGQRATFGSAFTLDGVGNRTQVDLTEPLIPSFLAENTGYTYDVGNILSAADGVSYTHDANGNRTSKTNGTTITTYTYDSLNRLTQVVGGSRTIQYIYNGLGERIGRIDNGVQTNYLVDPHGILPQVLAETDASNNLIAFYVYDGAGLVAKITPSNEYYFYHYDGLGSTIAITDASAQVVNSYVYSPEGLVGAQETIPNPFQYVGRFGVMAEGNGLYFMRARYYDPEAGRFISKDPIGYSGGLNLFSYGGNNPIRFIDPFGLTNIIWGVGGSAVAPTGVEGSVGGVLNPGLGEDKFDVGYFASVGAGGGVNVSADVFVGYIKGNISDVSGVTTNINVVGGPIGVTIFINPKTGEVIGATIGAGPAIPLPVQASGSINATTVYLKLSDLLKLLDHLKDLITGDKKLKPKPCQ